MTIKRKILVIILTLSTVLCMCVLTGCNENLGFGNYNWQHIHFSDAIDGHCATISSWHDNETGIEVHTKEYGSMFLSEGSYILFESEDCPFCRGGN